MLRLFSTRHKSILIPRESTAKDLAKWLNVRFGDLAQTARSSGIEVRGPNDTLHYDMASLIAMEFGVQTRTKDDTTLSDSSGNAYEIISKRPPPTQEERLKWPTRAPVVTIMGHIDHGKTLTLDALRKTSVAKGEAGGITQHIGAFSVLLPSKQRITFIDTPGHALFTSMRARGAKVTDIVVLIVAADDGVKPQTIEAIHHAQAANVPLIVAINKCDKPSANPQRVMNQLLEHGIHVEQLGGEIQCVEISATTGAGLDLLEECIVTQSELMDLRGDASGYCEATIIESKMIKGKGTVATVLVQRGTLKPNSVVVFNNGKSVCRVRRLSDENGQQLKQAPPSTPCEVMGAWNGTPEAGDEGVEVKNEPLAKRVHTEYEQRLQNMKQLSSSSLSNTHVDRNSYEYKMELFERKKAQLHRLKNTNQREVYFNVLREVKHLEKDLKAMKQRHSEGVTDATDGDTTAKETAPIKNLNVIVKADVHGSVEAVIHSLHNINNALNKRQSEAEASSDSSASLDNIQINVLHSAVGPISQSDVELLAATSKSDAATALIAFNLPQPKTLTKLVQNYRIPVISHNIIYHLLDDVKKLVSGMLTPDYQYEVVGEASVLALFKINGDNVAGCRVQEGTLYRGNQSFERNQDSSGGDNSAGDIKYRVLRGGIKIHEGVLRSLKHHKNDAATITKGMECGLSFGDSFKDVQVGDVIQCVHEVTLAPTLD